MIETQNVRYFTNIREIIGEAKKQITIRSIQSLIGRLMVLTRENTVILLKDNETNFTFDKIT